MLPALGLTLPHVYSHFCTRSQAVQWAVGSLPGTWGWGPRPIGSLMLVTGREGRGARTRTPPVRL